MKPEETLWIPLAYIFMTAIALQGLLGAIYKDFWFAKSPTLAKKHYQGRNARNWGIIFFVVFGIFPVFILIDRLKDSQSLFTNAVLYVIFTTISLALAFSSRKYGIYKVK